MEIKYVTANWLVSHYLRAANSGHLYFLAAVPIHTQL